MVQRSAFATPAMSTDEVGFMRGVVTTRKEIRDLRAMADRRITESRLNVTTRIANALYRRYKNKVKHGFEGSFGQWLSRCSVMEFTYSNHSYATRQFWSSRPIQLISKIAEFNYGEAPYDIQWYFLMIEERVNKLNRGDEYVSVYPAVTQGRFREDNPSVAFHAQALEVPADLLVS